MSTLYVATMPGCPACQEAKKHLAQYKGAARVVVFDVTQADWPQQITRKAPNATPTYWLVGSSIDFADPTASNLAYKRFAANGISTLNGDKLSLATNATNGRVTIGAAFNAFRPLPDANAIPTRDMRVSLGLVF